MDFRLTSTILFLALIRGTDGLCNTLALNACAVTAETTANTGIAAGTTLLCDAMANFENCFLTNGADCAAAVKVTYQQKIEQMRLFLTGKLGIECLNGKAKVAELPLSSGDSGSRSGSAPEKSSGSESSTYGVLKWQIIILVLCCLGAIGGGGAGAFIMKNQKPKKPKRSEPRPAPEPEYNPLLEQQQQQAEMDRLRNLKIQEAEAAVAYLNEKGFQQTPQGVPLPPGQAPIVRSTQATNPDGSPAISVEPGFSVPIEVQMDDTVVDVTKWELPRSEPVPQADFAPLFLGSAQPQAAYPTTSTYTTPSYAQPSYSAYQQPMQQYASPGYAQTYAAQPMQAYGGSYPTTSGYATTYAGAGGIV